MRCAHETIDLGIFCVVLLLQQPVSARGQVVPAATGRTFSVERRRRWVRSFSPITRGTASRKTSPNRLYGVGAYVDARFSRWLQIEAEGRWLRFNEYY